SWRLKFDAGRDAVTGKRVSKFITLHGTRKEAQAQAAKILAGVASGLHVDPSTETVAAFIERWLRDWAELNVGNSTFTRYAGLLRNNVAPVIGTIPLQRLQPVHLQQCYAAMAKAGLSDRTRLHAHHVTHTMPPCATTWGLGARSVAAIAEAPRVDAKELKILTPAPVQQVLEAPAGRPLYMIALLLLATGLRRGEALALRWQDIN